jgi:hypothetical protein
MYMGERFGKLIVIFALIIGFTLSTSTGVDAAEFEEPVITQGDIDLNGDGIIDEIDEVVSSVTTELINEEKEQSNPGEITPFQTWYGSGGSSQMSAFDAGTQLHWSVNPSTTKNYVFTGTITLYKGSKLLKTYWITASSYGNSGTIDFGNLKAGEYHAKMSGVAYSGDNKIFTVSSKAELYWFKY